MKSSRILIAFCLLCGLLVASSAQVGRRARTTARQSTVRNPQALAALQQDLENAIQAMTAALPIYDGNRVGSIHAAHEALQVVDKALKGNAAPVRQTPTARDTVTSGKARGKFSAQQVAQSQTMMKQGLSYLQAAAGAYQQAAGAAPSQRAQKVAQHLQLAISEAQKAISLHANLP